MAKTTKTKGSKGRRARPSVEATLARLQRYAKNPKGATIPKAVLEELEARMAEHVMDLHERALAAAAEWERFWRACEPRFDDAYEGTHLVDDLASALEDADLDGAYAKHANAKRRGA